MDHTLIQTLGFVIFGILVSVVIISKKGDR